MLYNNGKQHPLPYAIYTRCFFFFSGFFYRVVELNPDALKSRMDKFLDTCKNDKDTWSLQIQVFYALSNKYPEVC